LGALEARLSAKAIAILVVVAAVVAGGIYLRRSPAPKSPVAESAQTESAAEAPSQEPGSALPQARRSTNRAVRASEGSFKEQFNHIDALVRAGNAREALRLLEEILQKDPRHERALEEMGMLYLTEFQDNDKAIGYFKQALTVNPSNEFAVMELVGISLTPDKAGAMAEYLRSLYDANPNSSVLADGLGELYLSQGRFTDAVSYLEKSAQDSKHAEFANTRLGSVYEQMGDSDKAAEHYRRAIQHQGAELERRRAEGQTTELLEADMARSQLDLAHLLVKERRYDEAQELLNRARRRLGDDWEVQALSDQIRREMGS
jgi:tetratricopeptide (TPR) repeat protein